MKTSNLPVFENLQQAFDYFNQEYVIGENFTHSKSCIKSDGWDFVPNDDGTYCIENPADVLFIEANIQQCLEFLNITGKYSSVLQHIPEVETVKFTLQGKEFIGVVIEGDDNDKLVSFKDGQIYITKTKNGFVGMDEEEVYSN